MDADEILERAALAMFGKPFEELDREELEALQAKVDEIAEGL